MEGCDIWKKRFQRLLGAAGLILLGAPSVRAEVLCNRSAMEDRPQALFLTRMANTGTHVQANFLPVDCAPARVSDEKRDWAAIMSCLQSDWEQMRTEMIQSLLETAVTLYFIKIPTDPNKGPGTSKGSGGTPPGQGKGVPSSPGPATGQGGGTVDPTNVGPPPSAPEPATWISGMIGLGLASCAFWRKRRLKRNSKGDPLECGPHSARDYRWICGA